MKHTQSSKEDKQRVILEAAARIFARKGFARTLVADIAVEAGIGKGTVYEYFRSKEALFFGVFEWLIAESGKKARIDLAELGKPAPSRLAALGESLIKAWIGMLDMYGLILEFWAASSSSKLRDRFRRIFLEAYGEFRGGVEALIREGIARGEFHPDTDPKSVAAALVGTWDALLLQAWLEEGFDPLQTHRGFMTALLRGLVPPDRQGSGESPAGEESG